VPPSKLAIATFVSAPFAENSYVLHLAGRDDCVVIDPGGEFEQIIQYIEEQKLTPSALLLTHGHLDHIEGNEGMKARWPACPIVIGRLDEPKLRDPALNMSKVFGMKIISPPADQLLEDNEVFRSAGMEFESRWIPGHSCGHLVYVMHAQDPVCVLGGDVLFSGSVGRTDFADGSMETLVDGIHRRLFPLPDDTVVFPGHGPATTIGDEKESNPFVGRPSGWRE
jgi:glyoxylase-like metal-dependent hydrolase (beta-lactamase superfamily II)